MMTIEITPDQALTLVALVAVALEAGDDFSRERAADLRRVHDKIDLALHRDAQEREARDRIKAVRS